MAKVNIDLTEIEESTFAYISPGKHAATISKVTEGVSNEKRKNMLTVLFTLKTGEKIASWVMIEGKGAFKFLELYNAISKARKYNAGDKFAVDTKNLVGKQVGLVIEDREYENKVQSNIAQFIPVSQVKDAVEAEEVEMPQVNEEQPKKEEPKKPVEAPTPVEEEDYDDIDINF